jgi:hypothetical protein
MSVNEKMTAIADSIRDKTGGTEPLSLDDMASGVGEVYEAGKQAEYDAFWDAYQNNGNGMEWGANAFYGKWWNDDTFYPKYDIKPGGSGSNSYFYQNAVTNLRERIDGRGLKIILKQGNYLTMFFRDSLTVELPDFDTSPSSQFAEYCQNAKNLVTIPRINLTNATNVNNAFSGTTSLKNITFEGVIPISLNFQHSPLSPASLKSIIKHLKHYYGTADEFKYTLTVKASAWEALETAGFTDEDYQWVIDNWNSPPDSYDSWETLMGGWLGWNLVLA